MRPIAFQTAWFAVALAFACVVAFDGPVACPSGMGSLTCIGTAVGTMNQLSGLAAITAALLASALALSVLWQARRHRRIARALDRASTPARLMNRDVAIVERLPAAYVAGLARPRIYCPADLA